MNRKPEQAKALLKIAKVASEQTEARFQADKRHLAGLEARVADLRVAQLSASSGVDGDPIAEERYRLWASKKIADMAIDLAQAHFELGKSQSNFAEAKGREIALAKAISRMS